MPVQVRYYTDPACIWSWGAEPLLRRLLWEFGDAVELRFVMGGLARSYGPDYRDAEGGIGSGGDCFADLIAHWLDVAERTQMPCDPRLWARNPISSTYPVCQAVKAAAEQGPVAARSYLRRAREALVLERKKLDHAEALIGEAGPAGLDVERFRVDLASHAITEAFAADLDEVRNPPEEARRAGAVRQTEGRERLAFPSAVFIGEDGDRRGVWGYRPYEELREAAIAAGAEPVAASAPEPLEVVRRLGRCATREVEEICGRPTPPIAAELWALARDWRLRPLRFLTGVMWEPA